MLAHSLALAPTRDGGFTALADPEYEANTGMFGGWTAALLLGAVSADPRATGTPAALSVTYVTRISPGAALRLAVEPLGGSASIGHWHSEIRLDDGTLAARATIILTRRRPSDAACDWRIPDAAPPETLAPSHPPGAFGRHIDVRSVSGASPFGRPDMRSLEWVRETSGRAIDPLQLAFLADIYAPRIYHLGSAPRPSSTLTLSVHFLAADDELAAVGDDCVLTEAWGTRVEQALVGSQARLWSRAGRLLATSEQLCWFR